MQIKEILARCDHTNLSPTAVWEDIKTVCDDGMKYGVASVCIPPAYVRRAKQYVSDKLRICTVIGFPLGYSTKSAKVCEARCAVLDGADEIDMVINIGMLKDGLYDEVLDEIIAVRSECPDKTLKVIIETCLLRDSEKIRMCEIVSRSGADYIKTSTGFSHQGATFDDIRLMRQHVAPHLKIKAAGGISSVDDAYQMIALGADRLGTSRIVKIVKEGD